MRLGVLTPRYGEEVVGGAEHWLRSLSEHLVGEREWSVEVFTTCARAAETWADEYPPGRVEINGVTVNRFRSVSHRDPGYLAMLAGLRRDASALGAAEAERYVSLVGPVCPDAVDAAEAAACDLVAVTPYLYWPAVEAVPRIGRRVIFHSAAHDEPELYLPQMAGVFGAAGGFAYYTFANRDLVERSFAVGHRPSAVIGLTVDAAQGDPRLAAPALGLEPGEPFVLCLGRVEAAKGAWALAHMWGIYRERRGPGVPRLVFVGPVNSRPPVVEGVVYAGRQPDEVKWAALAACSVLVNPSVQESFSLVVLEAWLAGRPVMVNGRCEATVENCVRSGGGGVWFDGYAELEVALDRLLGDPALRDVMAEKGRNFALAEFSWTSVLDRYEELADRTLTASRWPDRPAAAR